MLAIVKQFVEQRVRKMFAAFSTVLIVTICHKWRYVPGEIDSRRQFGPMIWSRIWDETPEPAFIWTITICNHGAIHDGNVEME